MTQTLKKQDIKVDMIDNYYNTYYKAQNKIKPIVLNYLFRNISFLTRKEKIRALTKLEYSQISGRINVPRVLVHKFVSEFLVNLLRLKQFIRTNPNILNSKVQERRVRLHLYKLHRLAPIFDYKRAKENARILKIKLDQLFFWPQIMTQIAVIIFITDLLDKQQEQKIIQANLRALCSCSAYAFHRTRNKLGLTAEFVNNL
ncbi:MAG: hypothetical protein ACFFBK_09085 [Promethearchaeota archaeon]